VVCCPHSEGLHLYKLSDVSTHGTDLGKLIREDFWLIVTIME